MEEFSSTQWSMVIEAGGAQARPHLEALLTRYWPPIHGYIRQRWRHAPEDAADLAQAFATWMIESDFVGRAEPRRGSFRGFVKVALERFLIDQTRREQATKRGGDRERVAFDQTLDHAPDQSVTGQRPDELLDQRWRAELIRTALDSMESGYRCEGRTRYFDVFRDYFIAGDAPDYAALAARYELKRSDVSNMLMHAKRRYREVLRQLVVDTVESPEALGDELRWLVGITG